MNKKRVINQDALLAVFRNRKPRHVSKQKKCARCDKDFQTTPLRRQLCSDCWEYAQEFGRESMYG